MKLDIDLTALEEAVQQMGSPLKADFSLEKKLEAWVTQLSQEGISIELKDLKSHCSGLLQVRGYQILLYIQDHLHGVEEALADGKNGRRFHVAECSTLQEMKQKGRFQRYVVTNNLSGDFFIRGTSKNGQNLEGRTRLQVCQNCLKLLNYEGIVTHKNFAAVSQFDIQTFFAKHSSHFERLPKRISGQQDGYTPDWPQVSQRLREQQGYTCQSCHVQLRSAPYLVHVHHQDGVKSNNLSNNLQVLCADCHSKQPYHQHLFLSHQDRLTINQARVAQAILPQDWRHFLALADPALEGFIRVCMQNNYQLPNFYMRLELQALPSLTLEMAWPEQKLAVVISPATQDTLKGLGWDAFLPCQAVNAFMS